MIKCGDMDSGRIFFGKLAVIAFVFIVLNLWTDLADWVQATNVWWFVGAFVILVLIVGGGCCPVNAAVAKKTTKKKKK